MVKSTKSKTSLYAATGLVVAMMCAPALAQETTPVTTTTKATPDSDVEAVVIVKGLRKSLKSAVDRKRNSKQIVDSIDAEDAGKLPDNNVVEALAHVTGVQITRARGEGESLMIRGQADVQTTLNGSPNNAGVGRAASLNDIPAELLKSVQVYKTRTADQVEGGIAGTVNVDLRRPLDLKKGWTLAGSVRNVYGSIGDTESPYASALIAKRFDTPIGEMGFLLNMSYQENNYNEQYVQSETPQVFWGAQQASLPASRQNDTYGIYRSQYGVESGKVRRPSFNASYQWRVNEQLDVVLEASSFSSKENRSYSALNTRLKDSPGVLSNVVYGPDGKTVYSLTETDPNPNDRDILPVGPTSRDDFNTAENTRVNFEVHWHNDRATVNASVYRDENNANNQWITQTLRLKGLTGFNINMNSDKVDGGGPFVEYIGASPANINDYTVKEFEDGKAFESSKETVWQADLTYRLSDDKFLRTFQAGVRHSDRDADRAYGYRYAGFNTPVDLASFPGGTGFELVKSDTGGSDQPSWYRISRESLLQNYDAIRQYLYTQRSYHGGSGDWNTQVVDTEQLIGSFSSKEKTAAFYAQIAYGFKAWEFPVDGIIGGRSVRTWGSSTTMNRRNQLVNGVYVETPYLVTQNGDGTDFMPNATATVHFTPKLQLRLAYTVNIQRPNFTDSSTFVFYDTLGCNCGWGGNPNLRPNKETSYDASLEYYFGRGGVLSAATYVKKPDGFIIYGYTNEDYNGTTYRISRPVNAAGGEFRGFELNAQGFFDFLPSPWNNLGAQANLTYNTKAEIIYRFYNGEEITQEQIDTIPGIFDAPNNSKTTYNLTLYYETPKFSARVAYNYRDTWRANLDGYAALGYSTYFEPTSRLDMAINYTPVKFMTLSLEGTNLLEDNSHTHYGANNLLPAGVRVAARTVQLSARFRY
ncbi:TonB-dependent receptor [Asticcacaulis sp. 201]|uniref:TonB-dependent receptor n=1 Tax=Asticcacaulis sp. 201 TaxID=3028787 RepID=UPI002916B5F6|nr:TonB-dependent receptor [Asticcacaulis sp. 201]MDV6330346.1 TonB-dependent receptor [Asticcacaulis sp. 201]